MVPSAGSASAPPQTPTTEAIRADVLAAIGAAALLAEAAARAALAALRSGDHAQGLALMERSAEAMERLTALRAQETEH